MLAIEIIVLLFYFCLWYSMEQYIRMIWQLKSIYGVYACFNFTPSLSYFTCIPSVCGKTPKAWDSLIIILFYYHANPFFSHNFYSFLLINYNCQYKRHCYSVTFDNQIKKLMLDLCHSCPCRHANKHLAINYLNLSLAIFPLMNLSHGFATMC